MDLLELLLMLPNLAELAIIVCRVLWWLLGGLVTLLGLGVRGLVRAGGWVVERLRERARGRDFPAATVVACRGSSAVQHSAVEAVSPWCRDRP